MTYKTVQIPGWYRFLILGILLVTGGALIITGIFNNASAKRRKAACTARAEGTVTHVSTQTDGENHKTYSLRILFTAESGKRYEFETRHTGNKREVGDTVDIFYDPADPSNLYAETAPPVTGTTKFIMGGVCIVFGFLFFLKLIPTRNSGR